MYTGWADSDSIEWEAQAQRLEAQALVIMRVAYGGFDSYSDAGACTENPTFQNMHD